MSIETAWYLTTILFMFMFRDGDEPIPASMFVHHVIAIAFIRLSVVNNITRVGIVLLPYTTVANPFVHAAKALHRIGNKAAASTVFAIFFVVFTVVRMVAFPSIYMRLVFIDIGEYWRLDRQALYITTCGFLIAIYGLQILWYGRMLRIVWPKRRNVAP